MASPATQNVVARATTKLVVASFAAQRVITRTTREGVVTSTAHKVGRRSQVGPVKDVVANITNGSFNSSPGTNGDAVRAFDIKSVSAQATLDNRVRTIGVKRIVAITTTKLISTSLASCPLYTTDAADDTPLG